jgi:hypothetical protein
VDRENVDGRSAAALAAEACALVHDEGLAPRLYAQLLPRDGLCIVGGRGVYFRGAVARYLGLLAATLGRREDAVRHLETQLETKTRVQAPPRIARSLLDLGRALLARGRPGDKHRAIDMLRRAELQAAAGHRSGAEEWESPAGPARRRFADGAGKGRVGRWLGTQPRFGKVVASCGGGRRGLVGGVSATISSII